MTTTVKSIKSKMAQFILEQMGANEVSRYKAEFGSNWFGAQTIYKYGCLDIYDYDLFLRLKEFGVDTKAVEEYEKVLDWGCTHKHREAIRNEYIKAIYYALNSKELRSKLLED